MNTRVEKQAPTFTPARSQSAEFLQRKCGCGNHTVAGGECAHCSKKNSFGLQTKLTVGQAGDLYEQEADRIADQVMSAPVNADLKPTPQRIQRLANQAIGNFSAPASVDRALSSAGTPLDSGLRQDMEQRFGHDFSRVRVHTSAVAEESAQEVNANAYTVGQSIVFGANRFRPATHDGRRLIAHELTHVVQQSGADATARRQSPSNTSSNRHELHRSSDAVLQRDLALPPTNPNPQEVILTPAQIREAIRFNGRRYDEENTRLIQDVVGAPQTGVFDELTIQLIARYQDDFGLLPADGKVGPDAFDQLTAELGAENVGDQTCLTMFDVSDPQIPLNIQVAGPGQAAISSRFNVTARFSPHCNCSEFDYRQFICGDVTMTPNGGVATNINNQFVIPGGGLPQCPGWVQDGNTTEPHNGRYGHRDPGHARVNNRYLDNAGTLDMANGCRFEAFDVPGVGPVPDNAGDQYAFDLRFFGDIRRNGTGMQRKFWRIRDAMTIP
jgi:peptidoglycan hydrolase-like protein with peptidoglycan-binding domain